MIALFTILQSLAISLGVGSSTLAVTNFFVAIWDGKIDEHERRMMGVVYVVLRVAMIAILLTTLVLTVLQYISGADIASFQYQAWSLLVILFANAILMTLCLMPSAFGPAIQASSWYGLGIITSLRLIDVSLNYMQFVLLYSTLLFFAITFINLLLMYCKKCQEESKVCMPQ